MTGSLQIKNDKYYAVINIYENGKRKQKWIDTHLAAKGNKLKAEKFLRNLLLEMENNELQMSGKVLFSEYIVNWLAHKHGQVDEITYQGYEKLINGDFLPYFKAHPYQLSEITPSVMQEYFNYNVQHGRKDGKGGLSACTLKKHKNLLHQIIKKAQADGYVHVNACEYVELPKVERFKPNFKNKAEMVRLLEILRNESIYPQVFILSLYGLRRSELCGLQWNSVDFDEDTITICHTVVKGKTLIKKDKTKSESSNRTLPLFPEVKEMLLEIKKRQEDNRAILGSGYIDSPYIFTWDNGAIISPDYISHKFSKLLAKHNLTHMRLHDLRHSCASMVLSEGGNLKDVQEWLGHSDIGMTANIYGHLDMERKKHIANSMSQILLK